MPATDLDDAFGHHVWASVRLIDTCTGLNEEQLASAVPGIYGSILDTLRHLVGSDAWYLFVMSDGTTPQIDEDHMDVSELGGEMERHGDLWSSVLREDVGPTAETVAHHDDGSETRAPRSIRFAQALHHGTDHRSQICTALTQLGIEPPNIDVWAFGELDGRVVEVPAAP